MTNPLLVIITGRSCTGKTTLARVLATETGLPLIIKDDIKERLFDSMGWCDREWSKRLGHATLDLMFYFIEIELRAGHSLIAEANFNPQYHLPTLNQIRQRLPFRPLVFELVADGDVLYQRFIERHKAGLRHPGHVDQDTLQEADEVLHREKAPPFDLGGRYVQVDTNDFSNVDPQSLSVLIIAEL